MNEKKKSTYTYKQTVNNQSFLQDALTKELLTQKNDNFKNFQQLNQKINIIENKLSNPPSKWFEPTSLIATSLTIIGSLLIFYGQQHIKKFFDQQDAKKLILDFIENNKSYMMALSIELLELKQTEIETNSIIYTSKIESCKKYIESLKNQLINQEILSNSKLFDKQKCNKLIRYFFNLEKMFTFMELLIQRRFNKDEDGNYRLFDTEEYRNLWREDKLNNIEILTKYFLGIESISNNINFYPCMSYEEICVEILEQGKKARLNSFHRKLDLLNRDIDIIRSQLSVLISQSFDILINFDRKEFKRKFKNDEFEEQVNLFWNGGIFDAKDYPSSQEYWDDFLELKNYLEKNKK